MRFLLLTFLYCSVNIFSVDQVMNYSLSSPADIITSVNNTTNTSTADHIEPEASNIIFQSKDGGQTWYDISQTLPDNEEPNGFFAGASEIYIRSKNIVYHSKSNLTVPVWKKENGLDLQNTSIALNHSGVTAYNYAGLVFQKSTTGSWNPIYTNFKKSSMRGIYETANGTVFLSSDHGLYKSVDKGQNWKQVVNEGGVMNIVESEGVLIGTGQKGIIRSTDNGEHWDWVISEGGVGIAVERIDGGFAAISYNTLTQTRRIRISKDGGKTWKAIDEQFQSSIYISSFKELPPAAFISSIKQIGSYLLCGHPNGIYRSADMGKTWNIVHSSVDNKVFKIYTSGNVLYALLVSEGC